MFPVIKIINVNAPFKYSWLKYVNDIDLSVHCAKCLIGEYSLKINNQIQSESDIVLDEEISQYYYLCGVSLPYRWSNNFHLAFRFKAGSSISANRNGIEIIIENAEEIKIDSHSIKKVNHFNSVIKAYFTCRNWQFANQIYLEDKYAKN